MTTRLVLGRSASGPCRLLLTSYFPLLLAAAAASACTTTIHMQTPSGIASVADDILISRPFNLFDKSFSLGPYHVDHVATGPQTGSRFNVPLFSHGHAESGYSYDLEGPEGAVHGECRDESTANDVSIGPVTAHHTSLRLQCACGESDPPAAVLSVQGVKGQEWAGTLSVTSGSTYKLKSVYEMQGGGSYMSGPLGFRIDDEEGVAGAVEVLMPGGHAWLPRVLPDGGRAHMACLYAGLILFEPPAE